MHDNASSRAFQSGTDRGREWPIRRDEEAARRLAGTGRGADQAGGVSIVAIWRRYAMVLSDAYSMFFKRGQTVP